MSLMACVTGMIFITDRLLREFKRTIAGVALIPSELGLFKNLMRLLLMGNQLTGAINNKRD